MLSRGILPWDRSASSVEYEASCSPSLASSPERTSTLLTDTAAERTDRVPALSLDLAGDPLWDLLPLPDLELNPNELDELDQLPLDPRPDAELPLEEEAPDGDRCGEGDLARLRLEGECATGGGLGGRHRNGSVSAFFETWTGAVEVKAGGITLCFTYSPASSTAEDGLLQNILGLSATVKRWSVRKIQAVKPQPRSCIGRGREPANDG